MKTFQNSPSPAPITRRCMFRRMASVAFATFAIAGAMAGEPFELLANCVTYTLTPQIYNCKTGRWMYIKHPLGGGQFSSLASPEPNVRTRVRLVHRLTGLPVPLVLCKVDKRSHNSNQFPWHPYDSKLSDQNGYATFDPLYLSPGITWELRYSAPGAETVIRVVRVD